MILWKKCVLQDIRESFWKLWGQYLQILSWGQEEMEMRKGKEKRETVNGRMGNGQTRGHEETGDLLP